MEHHHEFEETTYFPMFSSKFDSTIIVAEHKLFHDGVQEMMEYLISCLPIGTAWGYGKVVSASTSRGSEEPVKFDGSHLCGIIDSFASPLVKHVRLIISSL